MDKPIFIFIRKIRTYKSRSPRFFACFKCVLCIDLTFFFICCISFCFHIVLPLFLNTHVRHGSSETPIPEILLFVMVKKIFFLFICLLQKPDNRMIRCRRHRRRRRTQFGCCIFVTIPLYYFVSSFYLFCLFFCDCNRWFVVFCQDSS